MSGGEILAGVLCALLMPGTAAPVGEPRAARVAGPLTQVVEVTKDGGLTLESFAQRMRLPLVLSGGLPARPYPYSVNGQMAGDVLEDMCEFYGCTWQWTGGWCVVEALPESPCAAAPEAVRWLEATKSLKQLSLDQLVALSRYDAAVLRDLGRDYPALAPGPGRPGASDWPSLRFIGSLNAEQRGAVERDGLTTAPLAPAQMELLSEALRACGLPAVAGEGTARLRLGSEQVKGRERWVLTLTTGTGRKTTLTLLTVDADRAGGVPSVAPDPAAGTARSAAGGRVDLAVDSWTLRRLLDWLNKEQGTDLAAQWELSQSRVSAVVSAATVEEVESSLASVFRGQWEPRGAGRILMKDPEAWAKLAQKEAARRKDEARAADRFIEGLVDRTSWGDRQLLRLAAIDADMYNQLNRRGTMRCAIEAYAGLPPQARSAVQRSGRWRGRCIDLPPPIRQAIAGAVSWVTTGHGPVISAEKVGLPEAQVEFERSRDLIVLTVTIPGEKVSRSFGRGATTYYAPPPHLGVSPWYLRFPAAAPAEHVEHLREVREWRGELSVRYLAPLAFLPSAARKSLRPEIPEVERIGDQCLDFLMLYALATPDQRAMMCSAEGVGPKKLGRWGYGLLLAAAGYPTVKVPREGFLASRLRLLPGPGGRDLDCEFRYEVAARTIVGKLKPPPEHGGGLP